MRREGAVKRHPCGGANREREEPFATCITGTCRRHCRTSTTAGSRRTLAKAFADYAGYISEQLGDRVKHYFTINEFASFVEGGYQGLDVKVGGEPLDFVGINVYTSEWPPSPC
ncbi:MAG TPA: hypothetical protein VIQ02_03585 [Jiangellaceae bacterium]